MSGNGTSLLSVNNIEVIYDHVILVLKGVSLEVPEGGIVALLGANGAGKTTTLKATSNLLRAERGDVTKGDIKYRGERIDSLSPDELVKRGVIQVMEGRHCFDNRLSRFRQVDRVEGVHLLEGHDVSLRSHEADREDPLAGTETAHMAHPL